MKTLSILGYYGYGNCGDEALKVAMTKIFGGTTSLNFVTPDDQKPIPEDEVILGGGDVLKDYFLNRVTDKKVKVFGAGLGYESELDVVQSYGNVTEMFLRNKTDVQLAKARGLAAHYTPDIAFVLDQPAPAPAPYIKVTPGKKTLVVMLADDISESFKQQDPQQIYYGQYLKNELASTLDELQKYYTIAFLPMSHAQYAYDVKLAYEVISLMPTINMDHSVLPPKMDVETVMRVVGEADLVLSMRFHGLIFSTIAGVPFINMGVSRKTSLYMMENALGDLSIEPFTFTKDLLLKKVKRAEDDLTPIRVEQARDTNKAALLNVVNTVRSAWC